MNFEPLYDRVIVKKNDKKEENVTSGGIYIPETAMQSNADSFCEGTVVAVGHGRAYGNEFRPLKVRVGQKILYSSFSEHEIKVNGEKFICLREDEVVGIFSEE